MKRLGTILMACALVLGLSQCKKENTNANVNEEGEKVYIVLKVEDGQRSVVTPSTGMYTYETGDKLLVGYNGAYCGVLSYNSSNEFSGYITISEDVSQPLYFYYIGEAASVVESGGSYTIDISNQSEGLPVLACAHSSVNYSSGKSNYHAHLRNKCSLVEFSLAEGTSDAVTVGGMHTVASIDFANGTIVATSATGDIKLYSESAESTTSKWAILLPQAKVPNATVTIGTNEGYTAEVPDIEANEYVHDDDAVAIKVDYVFTVDADGTTVHFAPGNLQYDLSTSKWSFMDPEWTIIEQAGDEVGDNYEDFEPGIVSLFTWGANGLSGVNPYDTDYNYWEGTTTLTLTGENPSDWGAAANDANLGGHNDWRTLTKDEWVWLLGPNPYTANPGTNCRSNATSLYGAATVNGVHGLIILPDNFDGDVSWNSTMSGWGNNVVSASEWEADWESHGAVFLPAAGRRNGTDVEVNYIGNLGYYWSASPYDEDYVYGLAFLESVENGMYPGHYDYGDYGYSVRLVR